MREKILRTTARILHEEGFEAATTRRICKELGITSPTLYYYFGDKETLYRELVDLAFEKYQAHLQLSALPMNAIDGIGSAWDRHWTFFKSEPALLQCLIHSPTMVKNSKVGCSFFRELSQKFDELSKNTDLKHQSDKAATIFLAVVLGSTILQTLRARDQDFSESGRCILDHILDGFRLSTPESVASKS